MKGFRAFWLLSASHVAIANHGASAMTQEERDAIELTRKTSGALAGILEARARSLAYGGGVGRRTMHRRADTLEPMEV